MKDGFSLIEMLVTLFIIGILTVLLLPHFQTSIQKTKQKATMAEIHSLGEAVTRYIMDKGVAPPNPEGALYPGKSIINYLSPLYIKIVPLYDNWGNSFWMWTGPGIEQYGITTSKNNDFIIASLGRKGEKENWTYDPADPLSGLFSISSLEDFERDLVLWNGEFIRRPETGIK